MVWSGLDRSWLCWNEGSWEAAGSTRLLSSGTHASYISSRLIVTSTLSSWPYCQVKLAQRLEIPFPKSHRLCIILASELSPLAALHSRGGGGAIQGLACGVWSGHSVLQVTGSL